MTRTYNETLETLFSLMTEANAADSDQKAPWQDPYDADQRGYFGELADAVRRLGGDEIYDHWVETSEIDLIRATRNTRERVDKMLRADDSAGKMIKGVLQCLGFTADERREDDEEFDEPLFGGSGDFDQNWDVWSEIRDIISQSTLHTIVVEALCFMDEALSVITAENFSHWNQLGVDFVLSRNGHGSGFFDRDDAIYGEGVQDTLQKKAQVWGTYQMEGTRNEDGELTEIWCHC